MNKYTRFYLAFLNIINIYLTQHRFWSWFVFAIAFFFLPTYILEQCNVPWSLTGQVRLSVLQQMHLQFHWLQNSSVRSSESQWFQDKSCSLHHMAFHLLAELCCPSLEQVVNFKIMLWLLMCYPVVYESWRLQEGFTETVASSACTGTPQAGVPGLPYVLGGKQVTSA